jgi:hypothetical protein
MQDKLTKSKYTRKMINLVQISRKKIDKQFRLLTWKMRSKPGFMILGAMKSGTTSLYYYLTQHPQIVPAMTKEVHFFDGGREGGSDDYQKGISYYLSYFPYVSELNGGKQTFEATPSYIFHPLVPERVHETLPNVKMVVLLRNPTQRAISHYFHKKRTGVETLPMMEAFQKEEARLKPIFSSKDYFNKDLRDFSYKMRGHYAEQLERYFKLFPREQFLILSSEDFFTNTQDCLNRIFKFINLEGNVKIEDLSPKFVAKNKETVSQEVVDYLNDYFRPKNQALYQLLGTDFGWK